MDHQNKIAGLRVAIANLALVMFVAACSETPAEPPRGHTYRPGSGDGVQGETFGSGDTRVERTNLTDRFETTEGGIEVSNCDAQVTDSIEENEAYFRSKINEFKGGDYKNRWEVDAEAQNCIAGGGFYKGSNGKCVNLRKTDFDCSWENLRATFGYLGRPELQRDDEPPNCAYSDRGIAIQYLHRSTGSNIQFTENGLMCSNERLQIVQYARSFGNGGKFMSPPPSQPAVQVRRNVTLDVLIAQGIGSHLHFSDDTFKQVINMLDAEFFNPEENDDF